MYTEQSFISERWQRPDTYPRGDLRSTAIRLAAREVLITHFGGYAVSGIHPCAAHEPLEGRRWGGTSVMVCQPRVAHIPRRRASIPLISKTPKRWREYVGISGFVAEQLIAGQQNEFTIWWKLREVFESIELEPTDLQSVSSDLRKRDVEQTTNYLRFLWTHIERRAEQLVDQWDEAV